MQTSHGSRANGLGLVVLGIGIATIMVLWALGRAGNLPSEEDLTRIGLDCQKQLQQLPGDVDAQNDAFEDCYGREVRLVDWMELAPFMLFAAGGIFLAGAGLWLFITSRRWRASFRDG